MVANILLLWLTDMLPISGCYVGHRSVFGWITYMSGQFTLHVQRRVQAILQQLDDTCAVQGVVSRIGVILEDLQLMTDSLEHPQLQPPMLHLLAGVPRHGTTQTKNRREQQQRIASQAWRARHRQDYNVARRAAYAARKRSVPAAPAPHVMDI
jgi:hypothetical protein